MDQNLQQLAQLLGQNFNQEELDSLLGNVKGFKERDYSKYKDKPLLYIREVLGGNVWEKQREIIQSYVDNQITIVTSAHSQGKTNVMGSLVNYAFDVHQPGTLISTAPSQASLEDVLWAEVRLQRKHDRHYFKPAAPVLYRGPDSRASGFTAAKGEAFFGRHIGTQSIIIDEACFSEDTDVLTDKGWMFFKDLTGEEKLLSMDPDTYKAEYIKPTKLYKYDYDGELYNYDSWGANFSVTPNHKFLYRGQTDNWRKDKIKDIDIKVFFIPRHFEWDMPEEKYFTIPELKTQCKYFPEVKVPFNEWAFFCGWYISEGCAIRRKHKGSTICRGLTIYQKDREPLDKLAEIVRSWGFKPIVKYRGDRTCHEMTVNSTQLGELVGKFGRTSLTKYVPEEIRFACKKHIQTFLHAFIDGDGSYTDGGKSALGYTSSKDLADGLQELSYKAGWRSRVRTYGYKGSETVIKGQKFIRKADQYCVYFGIESKNKAITVKQSKLKKEPYKGYVYCAEVPPHNLLFTRRNGHCMWSGNSGVDMKIFKASKSMLTKPEDRLVMTMNPIDPSCAAYQFQMQHPKANVIQVNMAHHPNIRRELNNEEPPIPHASRLSMFMGYLNTETDIIHDKDAFRKDVDLTWPDDEYKVYKKYGLQSEDFSGIFEDHSDHVILKPTMYRVSAEFESRVLGRWPSDSVSAVWSQVTIKRCETEQQPIPVAGDRKWGPPVASLDPALFGSDYSVFMVRWGPCIVECLAYQSTEPEFLNSKMKKLVDKWAKEAGCERSDIKCYFDSGGGYGSALMMFKEGYNFIPINGAEKAMNDYVYENRRAELWFNASERGKKELVEWTRLTRDQRQIISSDLLACQYKITGSKARRQLMRKDEMRRSIGRSPDYGDALALVCIDYYKEPEPEKKRNYSFREKENFYDDFKNPGNYRGGLSRGWMG